VAVQREGSTAPFSPSPSSRGEKEFVFQAPLNAPTRDARANRACLRRKEMKKLSMLVVIVLVLLAGFPAYSAVDTNMSFPVAISVFIPCAVGGAGEVVTLTGNLHVLISTTVNANHISVDMHFQPQGISGTGSVSGDKYQGTGITRFSFEADVAGFPFIETSVNNFKIIGQGPGNNFLLHENVHLTVNANGAVTTTIDNSSASCK
jgi:hypothetical protein